MDWTRVTFDWNRARAFLVTAEEGSFSAAARALGSTQPTLSRQVAALEEELGLTLFARVGTRLELTESGLELLERARPMGEAAVQLSLAAASSAERVVGPVTVTAGEVSCAFLLPPLVARLRVEHPGITVELVATNEVRSLQRREADIALRSVRPAHPDLYARRMRDETAGLFGARAYLERIGPLRCREDLARAEILNFNHSAALAEGLAQAGLPVQVEQFPTVASNQLVQWALCRAGAGLCLMVNEVGRADPAVARVLPDFEVSIPRWLVCHRDLRTSRRLRVVWDQLAELFA
ncbi:MAG: LysR family transcriptional regulator [Alphaproteobacteria bacterium]|nr:LysR family transcriptional regulator [Alphaproteobacteria bacterium]